VNSEFFPDQFISDRAKKLARKGAIELINFARESTKTITPFPTIVGVDTTFVAVRAAIPRIVSLYLARYLTGINNLSSLKGDLSSLYFICCLLS